MPFTTEWAAVAAGFPANCLVYYSSATGAWMPLDFSAAGYAGVEHYKGWFYVAFKSQLCVCEPEGDAPAVIPLEHIDGDGSDDEKVPGRSGRCVVEMHLVECDDELLLVSVHDDVEHNSDDNMGMCLGVDEGDTSGGGDAHTVEVHRVEWMGNDAVRLVRQEDLGWHALFLGRNRAFVLSRVPCVCANCVYLMDRQGHPDGLVKMVDMESRRAHREETIFPHDGR